MIIIKSTLIVIIILIKLNTRAHCGTYVAQGRTSTERVHRDIENGGITERVTRKTIQSLRRKSSTASGANTGQLGQDVEGKTRRVNNKHNKDNGAMSYPYILMYLMLLTRCMLLRLCCSDSFDSQFLADGTANLRTKILDFRGFDSSRILFLRGGILMSIGDFPEVLSQQILVVGIIMISREIGRIADMRRYLSNNENSNKT